MTTMGTTMRAMQYRQRVIVVVLIAMRRLLGRALRESGAIEARTRLSRDTHDTSAQDRPAHILRAPRLRRKNGDSR